MIHYLTRLDPAQGLDPFVILAQPKIGLGLDPFVVLTHLNSSQPTQLPTLFLPPPPKLESFTRRVLELHMERKRRCSILTVNSTRKLTINWQQILALLIYTSRANLITLLFRISEVLFVYKYFIKEFLY